MSAPGTRKSASSVGSRNCSRQLDAIARLGCAVMCLACRHPVTIRALARFDSGRVKRTMSPGVEGSDAHDPRHRCRGDDPGRDRCDRPDRRGEVRAPAADRAVPVRRRLGELLPRRLRRRSAHPAGPAERDLPARRQDHRLGDLRRDRRRGLPERLADQAADPRAVPVPLGRPDRLPADRQRTAPGASSRTSSSRSSSSPSRSLRSSASSATTPTGRNAASRSCTATAGSSARSS